MKCNAEAVRLHSEKKGWSQDKLALMCDLNIRTIQRAEAGEAMNLETYSQISQALGVPLADITSEGGGGDEDDNLVVLKRCAKGVEIVNLLDGAFAVTVNLDVEPESEWVDDTAALLDEIELLSPDWVSPPQVALTIANRLRKAAMITKLMQRVLEGGVKIFGGQYTALERTPWWDLDEGHWHWPKKGEREPVKYVVITLSALDSERIASRVANKYVAPPRETFTADLDDEIPF